MTDGIRVKVWSLQRDSSHGGGVSALRVSLIIVVYISTGCSLGSLEEMLLIVKCL